MERRVPLRLGSMSDSFMWLDTKYGVTKEMLKILKFYDYPNVIFTRSDLVAHDDYLSLMDQKLSAIQFSISGNNHSLIKHIEPGAPSYRRRLTAIRKLVDAGFWASVRINPLFPKYPDGYFSDSKGMIERFGSQTSLPTFDMYNEDFISELGEAGAKSILVGFVRLSGNAIKSIERDTGINLKQFFLKELSAKSGNSESRYSDKEISAYYRWFGDMCRKANIRFSTCYIGMGLKDYFQYQDLWANKSDCCDIKGNLSSFKASSQEIPWEKRMPFATNKSEAQLAKSLDEADTIESKTSLQTKSETNETTRN